MRSLECVSKFGHSSDCQKERKERSQKKKKKKASKDSKKAKKIMILWKAILDQIQEWNMFFFSFFFFPNPKKKKKEEKKKRGKEIMTGKEQHNTRIEGRNA